jgi:hypothetical protein
MIRPSIAVFVLLFVGLLNQVHGYSVLSHEALIDAGWETGIRPVLLRRFPNATPDELRQARPSTSMVPSSVRNTCGYSLKSFSG